MPAREVRVEVLEDAHHAGGLGAGAVGGDRHEVQLHVGVQGAGEVGDHHHGALEHGDDEQVLVRVVAVDLAGQVRDRVLHVLAGHEDVAEVVLDILCVHAPLLVSARAGMPGRAAVRDRAGRG